MAWGSRVGPCKHFDWYWRGRHASGRSNSSKSGRRQSTHILATQCCKNYHVQAGHGIRMAMIYPDLLVVISITSRTKQDQQVGTYAPWTLPSRTSETLPVFIVHTQARWWCLSRGLPNKHVCKANSNTIPATSCCELWWTRPSQGAADINPIDIRTFDSIIFATQKNKVLRQRFNYVCSTAWNHCKEHIERPFWHWDLGIFGSIFDLLEHGTLGCWDIWALKPLQLFTPWTLGAWKRFYLSWLFRIAYQLQSQRFFRWDSCGWI